MPDTVIDIASLLKRLEALKAVIALQDIEDITTQAAKLERLTADFGDLDVVMETAWILDLLNTAAYGDAMRHIEALKNRFLGVGITLWADPEIDGLRTEVSVLAAQINSLEAELGDIEKVMYEFEARQTRELGEIALKVLNFKKKRAASKAEQQAEDTDAQRAFRDAQQEEEKYRGSYEEKMATPMHQLDEAQLKGLKAKFKKIAKLTHPDLVDKRFEREAVDLFRRAKQAKDINDLQAIIEIYDYLVDGKPFVLRHETLTETESLRTEANYLRKLVSQLAQKVAAIKISDAYQAIIRIDDWGQYFSDIKAKMLMELDHLQVA